MSYAGFYKIMNIGGILSESTFVLASNTRCVAALYARLRIFPSDYYPIGKWLTVPRYRGVIFLHASRSVAGKLQTFSLAEALDRKAEESIRSLSSSPFDVWGGDQKEPDLAATSDGYTVTCVILELTETKWCYISLTFKVCEVITEGKSGRNNKRSL